MIKNIGSERKLWNTDLFEVILQDRNIHLANEIEKTKHKKIIITYGLMHFKWTLDLLKQQDPNWKIHTHRTDSRRVP